MEKQEYVLDILELIPEDLKGNLVLYNDCPLGRAMKRKWPELKWMEVGVESQDADVTGGPSAFAYTIRGRSYNPVLTRLNGVELPPLNSWAPSLGVTVGWGSGNALKIGEAIRNKTFKSAQVEFKEIIKTPIQ